MTDELDIALIGKSRLEYGEIFNENILHLLENFACPEGSPGVPDSSIAFGNLLEHPTVGQVWYNKTQKKPFVYTETFGWTPISSMEDVAGNSGVLLDGEFIPQPISRDGYQFKVDECVWNVSPHYIPEEFDFLHVEGVKEGVDDLVRIRMEYRALGDTSLSQGYANYQILGIRNHVNAGPPVTPQCTVAFASLRQLHHRRQPASATPTPTLTNERLLLSHLRQPLCNGFTNTGSL